MHLTFLTVGRVSVIDRNEDGWDGFYFVPLYKKISQIWVLPSWTGELIWKQSLHSSNQAAEWNPHLPKHEQGSAVTHGILLLHLSIKWLIKTKQIRLMTKTWKNLMFLVCPTCNLVSLRGRGLWPILGWGCQDVLASLLTISYHPSLPAVNH